MANDGSDPSSLELKFDQLWDELFPEVDLIVEQKIIPKRRYSFDYLHPQTKTAIEVNGQIWHRGGHSSGSGLMRDYEKLNLAALEGYTVFQLSSEMIDTAWLVRIGNYIKNQNTQIKLST